jgi:DNA polymerase III alpha subunit
MALARSDAFASFELNRRQACWAVQGLWTRRQAPLLAGLAAQDTHVKLPKATPYEELQQDYLATGISLRAHPIGLARADLDQEGVVRIEDLADHDPGDQVLIAGLVLNRQRPGTASGVVFMTLEDETGMANVVVWPSLYEKQRRVIRGQQLVKIRGELQKEGDAFSVLAQHFTPLPLDGVKARSRDFK